MSRSDKPKQLASKYSNGIKENVTLLLHSNMDNLNAWAAFYLKFDHRWPVFAMTYLIARHAFSFVTLVNDL